MTEKLTTNLEETLKQALFNTIESRAPYPGYPTTRLTAANPNVAEQLQQGYIASLPDGPWNAGYQKLKRQLTPEEVSLLALQGYAFDQTGRPLHPWLTDMLENPHVGIVTGTGEYWNMGPNRTVDPIIVATEDQPYVLLVLRADTKLWALPGGFIDPGETIHQAGCREASEESGIAIPQDSIAEIVLYDGVVADTRTTAYAWAETTALLFRHTHRSKLTPDLDEVDDAQWFPLSMLPSVLHGSHGVLLQETQKYENARI